jgi:hypothetical protein
MDRNFLQTGLYEISYNPHIRLTCVLWHVRNTCYLNSMYFVHFFLIALIKKTCDSHMFKGYVSFLNMSCKKFLTNQFVRNFCPYYIILVFFSFHFLSIFYMLLFFHYFYYYYYETKL